MEEDIEVIEERLFANDDELELQLYLNWDGDKRKLDDDVVVLFLLLFEIEAAAEMGKLVVVPNVTLMNLGPPHQSLKLGENWGYIYLYNLYIRYL